MKLANLKTLSAVGPGLVLALSLGSSLAHSAAGGSSGGGGNVVICSDPKQVMAAAWGTPSQGPTSKLELLDVYEARILRGRKLNLGDPSLSVADKVNLALASLRKVDPYRAEIYQGWANEFMNDATIGDFDLTPTNDALNKILPNGCSLGQLIIQQEPEFPGDKRYLINRMYWAGLDSDNQAAGILHEISLREARADGQTDSKKARYFNSMLFSRTVENLSLHDYYELLKLTGLVGVGDEKFFADGVLYDETGEYAAKLSINERGTVTGGFPLSDIPFTVLGGIHLVHKAGTRLERWDDGSVKSMVPQSPTELTVYGRTLRITYDSGVISGCRTDFDEKGNLIRTCLQGWHTFSTPSGDFEFRFSIEFRPDGSIASGYIWTPKRALKLSSGEQLELSAGYYFISFDEDGQVSKAELWLESETKSKD